VIVRIKSKLIAASFWSLNNDTKHLLIVRIEGLQAGWVSKPVFLAHSGSHRYCNVDALQARKVCSPRRTLRPAPEVDYPGMRKRLLTPTPLGIQPHDEGWLDLDRAASVEVTSEEKDYGIEAALVLGEAQGWRAANTGTQTIRLLFDHPQRLSRISLVFEETETPRTQEFVLRWSPDEGLSFREIVRQQWNFSPPDTIREVEEYRVELSEVRVLELLIVPDISRGAARASLKSLRVS
jgi:hypothetical protein